MAQRKINQQTHNKSTLVTSKQPIYSPIAELPPTNSNKKSVQLPRSLHQKGQLSNSSTLKQSTESYQVRMQQDLKLIEQHRLDLIKESNLHAKPPLSKNSPFNNKKPKLPSN